MTRFVVGDDRDQSALFPERLDDYLGEDNPVRAIDVLVDELDLAKLGFDGVEPEATGRPAYHPATLLKIYVYGYLNRVQSSRRLERECQRNIELVWLTGRLMPDFKTIADFRKDNGEAIRKVCREFVVLCRRLELFSEASVAIDGSKFKAVNTRDRNFTQAKSGYGYGRKCASFVDKVNRAGNVALRNILLARAAKTLNVPLSTLLRISSGSRESCA
ncbi:transposase [Bradyrhizobium sp. AZCC 2289]